jgi:hypothetical protein
MVPPIFHVPPLVIIILPVLEPPAPTVTFPETVNTLELLNVSVAVPEPDPELILIVAHAAFDISTVTLAVLTMVTSSPPPGTTPPTHVPVALQLPPAAVELIGTACISEKENNRIVVAIKFLKECNCVFIKQYFKD